MPEVLELPATAAHAGASACPTPAWPACREGTSPPSAPRLPGASGFSISSDDDLVAAQHGLTEEVGERIASRRVDVLVAPSPHDGHHGHEVVGRAARDAVEACGDRAPRLWL